MSGTVVLISAEYGRLMVSQQCFDALDLPDGAKRERYAGNAYVHDSRNVSAETFHGDWLCMIDDDHLYKPSILRLLLRHLDDPRVDIVTPFLLRRNRPHGTMLYVAEKGDPYNLDLWREARPEPHERGLIEVDGIGASFILIRRRVFDALCQPYFNHNGNFSEDLTFCCAARKAGFRIWCDLDLRVGHLISLGIWPHWEPSGWTGAYVHVSTVGGAQHTIASVLQQAASIERRELDPVPVAMPETDECVQGA